MVVAVAADELEMAAKTPATENVDLRQPPGRAGHPRGEPVEQTIGLLPLVFRPRPDRLGHDCPRHLGSVAARKFLT